MLEEVEQLTNWDDNPFIKLGEHVSKRYDLNYKEDHAVICILGEGASFLYKLFKKYFMTMCKKYAIEEMYLVNEIVVEENIYKIVVQSVFRQSPSEIRIFQKRKNIALNQILEQV